MADDNIIVSSTQAVNHAGAANISLLKLGTMAQTVVGVVVTCAVLAATLTTVLLISLGSGYQPPLVKNDYVTAYKTIPITINALFNDKDPKSGNLTIVKITKPKYGSASIINGKSILYTSFLYYAGEDSFNYTISNDKLSSTGAVFVDVRNTPPDLIDLRFTVSKNSKNNKFSVFDVVQQGLSISDLDNDLLFVVNVTDATHGTTSFDERNVYYTPNVESRSADEFTYFVSDRNSTRNATIFIDVLNDAPVAKPDSYRVPKNTVLHLNVLRNCYDINDDPISIASLGISRGVSQIGNYPLNTTVTYIPLAISDPYYDSIEFVVTDGELESVTYVTMDMYNTPPTANDLNVTVVKNTEGNKVVLGIGDDDILDTLSVSIVPAVTKFGQVSLEKKSKNELRFFGDNWYGIDNAQYTILYTPTYDAVQEDVVQFIVTDGYDSTVGQVYINIINTAPVANNDAANCSKNLNTLIDVLINDSDPNGDKLDLVPFTTFTTSNGGKVEQSGKKIKYSPARGFLGVDTFTYKMTDVQQDSSKALTATATVSVTVSNDAPIAVADAATVGRKLPILINVLNNDSDPNMDTIRVVSLGVIQNSNTASASIVTVNGVTQVNYTAGTEVAVVKMTYTIEDVDGARASSDVTITQVNNIPIANDDVVSLLWNRVVSINVIQNDVDANPGDVLKISDFTQPSHGSITNDGTSFSYTPTKGYVGSDLFTYRVTDGIDNSAQFAIVRITVNNNAPVSTKDSATTHWRSSLLIDVLSNDKDIDDDALTINAASLTQPSSGSVVIEDNKIRYTPANVFTGLTTFTYRATDGNKDSLDTVVSINVTNTVPKAVADSYSVHWRGGATTLSVLDNDSDPNGDSLTIDRISLPSSFKGVVKISSDQKTLSFTPNTTFVGSQSFTYFISDGPSKTSSAAVTIITLNPNVPQSGLIEKSVHWTSQSAGTVIPIFSAQNPVDSDGDSLTITVKQPTNGTATVEKDADGVRIRYLQNNNFLGSDSFTYTVSDGPASADVQVKFVVYNTVPTASSFATNATWRAFVPSMTVDTIEKATANDIDLPDNVSLKSIGTTNFAGKGTISKSGSSLTFTPVQGFVGTISTPVTFTDGIQDVTVSYTITVRNSAPLASPQATVTHWSTTVQGVFVDALSQITDADSDTIVNLSVVSATIGNAVVSSGGILFTQTNPSVGVGKIVCSFSDGWQSSSATWNMTVVNNKPKAVSQPFTSHWRLPSGLLLDVLNGCTDADSQDSLTISSLTKISPTSSQISVESGKVRFVPGTNFVGTDKFNFTITDGYDFATQTATVTLQNNKPVPVDDAVTMHWRLSTVSYNVLINDYDNDADPFTLNSITAQPSKGSAIIDGVNPSLITYTIAKPVSSSSLGTFKVSYNIKDAEVSASSAFLTVSVTNNNKPTTSPITASYHWREFITVSYTVSPTLKDQDNDDLTVSIVSNPTNFKIETDVASGSLKLLVSAPSTSWKVGSGVITYKLSDGIESSTNTISITVSNTAPSAAGFSLNMHWSQLSNGYYFDVLSKASDADVLDRSYLAIGDQFDSVSAGATVVKQANPSTSRMNIFYKPASSFTGNDIFYYYITDELVSTRAMINVTVASISTSSSDQYYTYHWRDTQPNSPKTLGLISYLNLPQSDTLQLVSPLKTNPSNGTVEFIDLKSVSYIQNSGFIGTDSFEVDYQDGPSGSKSTITVAVEVTNTNPTVISRLLPVHRLEIKNGYTTDVMDGAQDANSDPISLTSASVKSTSAGTVSLNGGTVTFTPTDGSFVGSGQGFTFMVGDEVSHTQGAVDFIITNNPPTTFKKTVSTHWRSLIDGSWSINVLNGSFTGSSGSSSVDFDSDALDSITVLSVSGSTPASACVITQSGSWASVKLNSPYTVNTKIPFGYTVTDGASNGQVSQTVELTAINTAPSAVDDTYSIKWRDTLVSLSVLDNDSDADVADRDYLTISSVKSTAGATVTISNDKKSLTYTPVAKFVGKDSVTYTVTDGASSTNAVATITVTNTAPVTQTIQRSSKWSDIPADGIVIDVVSTVVDADADPITLVSSVAGLPAGHTVTFNGGSIKYKPQDGFIGTASFVYSVTDSIVVVTGTIQVTITNMAPTSVTNTFSRHWRTTTGTLDLTPYLSDTDPLKLVSAVAASGSISIVAGTLSVQFNQATNFVGTTTFQVGFTDSWAPVVYQQFTVVVTNSAPIVSAIPISSYHSRTMTIPIVNRSDALKAIDNDFADSNLLTVVNSFSGTIQDSTAISLTGDKQGIVVVPVAGSLRPIIINYGVTDGVATSIQTITITLTNTAPVVSNFERTIHWTQSPAGVTFDNVLQGATDAESDTITVTDAKLASGTSGTVSRPTSTSVKYIPTLNTATSGNQVQYFVSDGAAVSIGNLTINVFNNAPTADSFSVTKRWNEPKFNISLTGRMNDSDDQDKPNLVPVDVVSPYATIVGSSIQFSKVLTPSDLTTTFAVTYKATDKLAKSAQQTISVTFTDAAPVATDATLSMKWNANPVTVNLSNLCSDSDDDEFISLINNVAPSSVSQLNTNPQAQATIQGTLSLVTPGTSIKYIPALQLPYTQAGDSKSFVSSWTYTCSDGFLTATGKVSITVTNTRPTAADQSISVPSVGGQKSYTIKNFFTGGSDVDGDSLSLVNVQGATVSGSDVIITVENDQVKTKTFTYQLSDGQLLSNVATVVVSLTNVAPTCTSKTIMINKGQTWSEGVSSLCSDANGHSMTLSIVSAPVRGISSVVSSTTLRYNAGQDRSEDLTLTYTATDSFGAVSTTATLTIRVINRSPRAADSTWNLFARRDSNVATFDVLTASGATDDDTYDSTRLTISQVTPTTCDSSVGTLSVVSNQIQLVRSYSFSSSSCYFYVVIQDADVNTGNRLTTTVKVTLVVTTGPLSTPDQTISVVDQDTVFTLSRPQILAAVSDPLGGSYVFDSWITDTDTCATAGFCRAAATPRENGQSYDFTQKSVQCQIDRFKFKVRSTTDPSIWGYAILNVQYTNCICTVPADIVLVFDGSGSVGEANWKKMIDFAYQLVSNFQFAEDSTSPNTMKARFGIVRFGTYIENMLSMTNSKSATLNAIQNLAYPAGGTPILDGLRLAEYMLKTQGRPSVINKVILTMFDGEPNGPCSCSNCRSRYASATSYTPAYSTSVTRENQCKSTRFPFRTCNACDINKNYALRCNPCSDIIPLTTDINSRRPDAYGNTPNGYWRIIPVGIGQALSNPTAQQLLKDMSYDPTRSFYVSWDQLTSLYQTVSDQTCNMIDISSNANSLIVAEPNEPDNLKCGDFVMLRSQTSAVYFSYFNYTSPSERLVSDYTKGNVAGTNRTAIWQVVCPSGNYGDDIIYDTTTISLWNLQRKQYLRRNSAVVSSIAIDALPQVTGTAADMAAGGKTASFLKWIPFSVGYTTSATKIYYDNTLCLGSATLDSSNKPKSQTVTSTGFLSATDKYPLASSTCADSSDTILFSVVRWKSIQNLAIAPALSPSELPMAIPASEYQ